VRRVFDARLSSRRSVSGCSRMEVGISRSVFWAIRVFIVSCASRMGVFKMFPNDATAEKWFVKQRWPDGLRCAYCDGDHVVAKDSHPRMPYRCHDCKKHYSVKTNSVMHASKIGYQKWAIAMYLLTTNLKGVSSMKLHRDLDITQKSAWHMIHRIRESWADQTDVFSGPLEVDETYIGGSDRNRHEWKGVDPRAKHQ